MSLYVLDTDTLTLLQQQNPPVAARVRQSWTDVATTVISIEEQLTGWYRKVRKARTPKQLAAAYRRLAESVAALSALPILTFSESAINRYAALLAQKLNIGKMDLRIAAIALDQNATVVTRNLRDFQRIPGLRTEDWSR